MLHNKMRVSAQVVSQVSETECNIARKNPMHLKIALPERRTWTPKICSIQQRVFARVRSLSFQTGELFVARTLSQMILPVVHHLQPLYPLLRAIDRIGPDIAAGVVRVKQFFKHVAVVNLSSTDRVMTDQLVFHIRRNMVLVTKKFLPFFFVQRASVSFWQRLWVFQSSGSIPALIC